MADTTPTILACVDQSAYASAVCDHAAWFSSRMPADVAVLHVVEQPQAGAGRTAGRNARLGEAVIARALDRLGDEGALNPRPILLQGDFPPIALGLAADAELTVVGKRGANSDANRQELGSNVDRLLRGSDHPICLVSQVFLPISRAVVLIDAEPQHRRAVEYVTDCAALRELKVDLVMMGARAADGAAKLSWAREQLGVPTARALTLPAEGPDLAVTHYLQARQTDLLILSHEVLLAASERRVRELGEQSFWRWRTPVLVC